MLTLRDIRRAAAVAALSVCGGVAASEESGVSKPFLVSADEERTESIASSAFGYTCSMQYSTRTGEEAPTLADEDREAAARLVASLVGPYSRRFGDWDYTVTLGQAGTVVQSSGDARFDLGHLDTTSVASAGSSFVASLAFDDGAVCEGTANRPRRRTDVSLHCGSSKGLLDGREPLTCRYAFALTDPALCQMPLAFPRHPAEAVEVRGGGGGGGDGGSGSSAGARGPSLDALLPAEARARLLSSGSADALLSSLTTGMRERAGKSKGQEQDGKARSGVARPLSPEQRGVGSGGGGDNRLSQEDVAGVGGASLGIDDSQRHGGRWSGLSPGVRDEKSGWTLALHPTWPHDHDEAEAQAEGAEAAGEGTEDSGAASTTAADTVPVWTCSAWSIDDLRRGTEGPAGGGVPLTSASLLMRLPAPAAGEVAAVPTVVEAVARNARRQPLPVQVGYAPQADGSVLVRMEVAAAESGDKSAEGEDGEEGEGQATPPSPSPVQEAAYLSLTLSAA